MYGWIFPPAGGYGDYILYYHKPPPGVKPFGTFIFVLFGFRQQFAGLNFAGGLNGTRCRFLSACPPCVKGGRGDWAVGTKTMAQSNAERYNVTVRIRIGFHRNELPTAQSLRPQCAHWGHLISGPRAAWRRLASETRLRALPLHKGGMRRCRASAINYNLSGC